MSEDLVKRIEALDDKQSVRILEFYAEQLFEGMETSPEEMIENIPLQYKDAAPYERIFDMSSKERARPLPEAESSLLARELLIGFARNPGFEKSLNNALDEYNDDTLLAGTILATGVAISMIIVAATTSFKGKIGEFDVVKKNADAELLKVLIQLFPKLD